MLKKMKSKFLSRLGFTITEVLIVVAILAVLAGVGVPSYLAIQKNLNFNRVNEAAQTIHYAAQNRMSELRASGVLTSLEGAIPLAGSTAPEDFPAELDWSDGESYYRISSTDAGISTIFPAGALESAILDGHFYVEYNKLTGMVYGVFYADEVFTYKTDLPRNDEKARRDYEEGMLGYYGGTDIVVSGVENVNASADFEIINADDLFLIFTPASGFTYDLTISDGTFDAELNDLSSLISDYPNVKVDAGGVVVTLDSLKSGLRFAELFPELSPGANLTVKLVVSKKDAIPEESEKTVNSLFASYNEGSSTATVSFGRHLQNLDVGHSALGKVVTNAVQGNDIPWNAAEFRFSPINNTALISYEGGNNLIRNLNNSLFDSFGKADTRCKLDKINIVDSSVSSTGEYVGTLANEINNTDVTGCTVYRATEGAATLYSDGSFAAVGGLVGHSLDSAISSSSASLASIKSASTYTGGLVGRLDGGSVSGCYAEFGVWQPTADADSEDDWAANTGISVSGATVGGLVGFSGGSIADSYSAGIITSSSLNTTAAGLVGEGPAPTGSYAAVTYVLPEGAGIYGITGGTGAAVNGCFFLGYDNINIIGDADTNISYLSYQELTTCVSGGTWSSTATRPYGRTDESYPFPGIKGLTHHGDWPSEIEPEVELLPTGFKIAIYYYEQYSNGDYGFHAAFHNGDVVNTLKDDLVVVEDGYCALHLGGASDNKITEETGRGKDITCYPGGTITDSDEEISITKMTLTDLSAMDAAQFYNEVKLNSKGEGTSYAVLNPSFAQTVINMGKNKGTKQTPPEKIIVRTARQLNNLAELTRTNSSYNSRKYTQTRTIDFKQYIGFENKKMLPIGSTESGPFIGHYYGNNNIITGLSIDASPVSGLFGYVNSARLEKIVLLGDSDTELRNITGAGDTGGIVANMVAGSVVEGCIVGGFNIGSNTGSAGGIVGVTGYGSPNYITDCTVGAFYYDRSTGAMTLMNNTPSITNKGASTGGLAGRLAGKDEISNCSVSGYSIWYTGDGNADFNLGGLAGYAGTEVKISKSAAVNGYFGEAISGPGGMIGATGAQDRANTSIAGFVAQGNATITNCYAIARFGNTGEVTPIAFANGGVASNCYSMAADKELNFNLIFGSTVKVGGCLNFTTADYRSTASFANDLSLGGEGWGTAAGTYIYDRANLSGVYPYPAIVKSGNAIVHYGNWPVIEAPEEPEEPVIDQDAGNAGVAISGTLVHAIGNNANIAITSVGDYGNYIYPQHDNFPQYELYHSNAADGTYEKVAEKLNCIPNNFNEFPTADLNNGYYKVRLVLSEDYYVWSAIVQLDRSSGSVKLSEVDSVGGTITIYTYATIYAKTENNALKLSLVAYNKNQQINPNADTSYWESSTDGGNSWQLISGSEGEINQELPIPDNETQYRYRVITNGWSTAHSNIISYTPGS